MKCDKCHNHKNSQSRIVMTFCACCINIYYAYIKKNIFGDFLFLWMMISDVAMNYANIVIN